jgi:hypothetical protein
MHIIYDQLLNYLMWGICQDLADPETFMANAKFASGPPKLHIPKLILVQNGKIELVDISGKDHA